MMGDKLDLVQQIGNKACSAATALTEFVAGDTACTTAQIWNMGALVMFAVIVSLAVMVYAERRRRFRETYFG